MRMTDASSVDDRDYGRVERGEGRLHLRFTRRFPQRPESVWRALTEPEHLAAWFPQDVEGERAAGARLRFVSREDAAQAFDGEMLAFEPPLLMEMRWGTDVLRFELRPDGSGTVLEFTDTFDEIGKGARDGAGWHACLDLLTYAVAAEPAPWSSADRFGLVHPGYVQRLGAELSTIGPPDRSEHAQN
jgi:uncharacterized protein YndB with AHSA1/START domain